jgi:hypothetical protein
MWIRTQQPRSTCRAKPGDEAHGSGWGWGLHQLRKLLDTADFVGVSNYARVRDRAQQQPLTYSLGGKLLPAVPICAFMPAVPGEAWTQQKST